MSRDRRWWSVPRVLPSFNLWRTSDPNEIKENGQDIEENEKKEETTRIEEMNKIEPTTMNQSAEETSQIKEEIETDSLKKLKFRRSPSKRGDRSRSSSLSNCSLKSFGRRKDRSSLSSEPVTPATAELPDLTGMPEISFSFFNDRDDEFVIIDTSIKKSDSMKKEIKPTVNKNSNSEDSESSYASTTGDIIDEKKSSVDCPERQDDCDGASLPEETEPGSYETDYEVKLFRESPPKIEQVRHISTLKMNVKVADYCNIENLQQKDNDYEELRQARTEEPYSSPRNSAIVITPVESTTETIMPIYSVVDKSNKRLEKSGNDAENKQETEAPEVPTPDWDPDSDGYNPDYAELTTPEPQENDRNTELENGENHEQTEPEIKEGPTLKHDYEDLEYCQHRANLRTNLRRLTLMKARRSSVSIKRVRSRIGRAWKAVKGWWLEERIRLGDVILKQAHEQAVRRERPVSAASTFTNDNQPTNRVPSPSEDGQEDNLTFTEGGSTIVPLKDDIDSGENTCDEYDCDNTSSVFSESCPTTPRHAGPVVRRRHLASPKPALSRSSSLINFRRSRYCPEVIDICCLHFNGFEFACFTKLNWFLFLIGFTFTSIHDLFLFYLH